MCVAAARQRQRARPVAHLVDVHTAHRDAEELRLGDAPRVHGRKGDSTSTKILGLVGNSQRASPRTFLGNGEWVSKAVQHCWVSHTGW